MESVMVSFLAEPELLARIDAAARIDGVTQGEVAGQAVVAGVLLSAAGRRNLRFVLEQGGVEAEFDLTEALSRAVTVAANAALKRLLLERARAAGAEAVEEEHILDEANDAVRRHVKRCATDPAC